MDRDRMAVELYIIHTGFLEEDLVFHKKLQFVSLARREKVLACKTRESAKRSLAAGLLLEHLLKEQGYSPEEVATEEGGKLYLPGVKDFFFSLSHSGEYAVCAVADVPVGVDIQEKRETRHNIAERFFHPEEAAHIAGQPDPHKDHLFFRYWTGKESYLKLTGQGFLRGLDGFLVNLEEKKIQDPYNENEEIYLKEYSCLEDYYITVACYSKKFAAFVKKIYYRI